MSMQTMKKLTDIEPLRVSINDEQDGTSQEDYRASRHSCHA